MDAGVVSFQPVEYPSYSDIHNRKENGNTFNSGKVHQSSLLFDRRLLEAGDQSAQSISHDLLEGARLAATLKDRDGGGFILQVKTGEFVTRLQHTHDDQRMVDLVPPQAGSAVRFEIEAGSVRFFFAGDKQPITLRLQP